MKHLTDFVKSDNGTVLTVTREFNAPVEKVWKAWTTAELLDKWWAPAPFVNKTKELEFKEDGHWIYSMSGEGQVYWARLDYKTIDAGKNFTAVDYFADENGKINNDLPSMSWDNDFNATATGTKVVLTITLANQAAMEEILKMGFQEGFTTGLDQLEELLEKCK